MTYIVIQKLVLFAKAIKLRILEHGEEKTEHKIPKLQD